HINAFLGVGKSSGGRSTPFFLRGHIPQVATLAMTPPEGYSRFMDALTVALNQAYDSRAGDCDNVRWFTSTLDLQLASLDLCRACRSVPTLLVKIDHDTPRSLWTPTVYGGADSAPSGRVPPLRAHGVKWEIEATFAKHVGLAGEPREVCEDPRP
ncbi:unnamed protein product, partial [Ectocarpus sp. 6 AP-2014]